METHLETHAELAAAELEPGVHASITMRHRGATVRVASSSHAAALCDQAEARYEEGPCVAAMTALEPITVEDVNRDPRWSIWAGVAYDEGFDTAVAVPARVDDVTAVALNLYLKQGRSWSEPDMQLARRRAELIAASLRARLTAAAAQPSEHSNGNPVTPVLEQAVGAIMHANGVDAGAARALLKFVASHTEAPVEEVAATILAAITAPR
ncbi:GAF domain-containing protein [Cellulomonas sp. Y8]|uniref:GAF domain-containing protein n=1 Tax=Cellulomonas sp. Y8 TaxID=2591145 RepID=UPI003D73A206